MECLRNIITVDWCGEDATLLPVSGQSLSINSLPGMSFKKLAMLASEEQKNWKGVWDHITLRASKRFAVDVRQVLSKSYKLITATQSVNIGKVIDTSTLTVSTGNYRGIVIELNYHNAIIVNSVLQQIMIDKLFYYHNGASAAINFYVFDIDTGTQLHTFAYTAQTGWNTIDYRQRFAIDEDQPRRIFVCFKSTVSTPELNIQDYNMTSYFDGRAYIRGGAATFASTVTDSTLTVGSNTYGLSAQISIGCSWENMICQNRQLFETAFWYLCGIEMMNEQINSDRLNQFTTINLQKAKDLRTQYEIMYMGGVGDDKIQHDGVLFQVIEGLNLDLNDDCIECNEQILIRETVT